MTEYSTDKPIENGDGDLFARKDFSVKVAEELISKAIDESYVIGLNSAWGNGKTSSINMIVNAISDRAMVVNYNPWIYTNQNAMLNGMYDSMADVLHKEISTNSPPKNWIQQKILNNKIRRSWRKRNSYGALSTRDTVGTLLRDHAEITGLFNESAGKGAAAIGNLLSKDSLAKIRESIEKKIKSTGKRMIIIIDDVDRLDPDEIFKVFKFVKAIGDFRGVTYLISFDDIEVAKSLNKRFAETDSDSRAGSRYIEKIIQVPLHLPAINQQILDKILFDEIEKIFNECDIKIDTRDAVAFRDVYNDNIKYIKTPRNLNRYLNAIRFTTPLIANEVNIADHLILESVRIFYPDIYREMSMQKNLFTGASKNYFADENEQNEQNRAVYTRILGNDSNSLDPVLKSLFPIIRELYGAQKQQSENERRFISNPDYFDRYFTYGIGPNDIADSTIIELLNLKNTTDIQDRLTVLLETKDQQLVTGKIKQYWQGSTNPSGVATSMFATSKLIREINGGFFRYNPVESSIDFAMMIISKLPNKLVTIKQLINTSDLQQLTYLLREVELKIKDTNNTTTPFFDKKDIIAYKRTALSRIRLLSKQYVLHLEDRVYGHHVYHYWMNLSSRTETENYILKQITNTEDVLNFITPFLATWVGGSGSRRGNLEYANLKYIDEIIDSDKLLAVIESEKPNSKPPLQFPDFRNDNKELSLIGNEESKKFREILLEQFLYLKLNKSEEK